MARPKPRPMPRYTPEEREAKVRIVAESIRNLKGCVAGCKTAGIPYETFCQWRKKYPELQQIIKDAAEVFEVKGEEYAVLQIFKHMEKHWQAGAWWLERKIPDTYALRSKQEFSGKCDLNLKEEKKIGLKEILQALPPDGRKVMTDLMGKALKKLENENHAE